MLREPDAPLSVNNYSHRITQRERGRNFLESIGSCVKPRNLARDLSNPHERGPILPRNLHCTRGGDWRIELVHLHSRGMYAAEIGRSRIRGPNTTRGGLVSD